MDVREIVKEYLEKNGYDGLFHPGMCSCTSDDLFPCGEPYPWCEPGYKVPCACGEGCDFDIGRDKPQSDGGE